MTIDPHGLAQPARGTSVHQIVLGPDFEPTGSRDPAALAALADMTGLVDLARRAGALSHDADVSFYWVSPAGSLVGATVEAQGTAGSRRTSLSWRHDESLPHQLTTRELDVLTLLIGGLGNAEIARRLWTSPRTITTHVERVLSKLAVPSRTAAATLAVEQSLLRLPIPGGPDGFERMLIGELSAVTPLGGQDPPRTNASPVHEHGRLLRRPILLGGAFPQSGVAAEDGLEMMRASQLALREINERGGIGGRRVELIAVDVDIQSAEDIETAFTALAAHDVDAMISGYLGHQDVAHQIAADHGAPYLHAATLNSMALEVADDPARFDRVFQVCPSDIHYGPGFVDCLSTLRDQQQWRPANRSLAVLRGAWKLGDIGIDATIALAEAKGWSVDYVAEEIIGEEQWRQHARKLAANPPAAVLIGSYFVPDTVHFIDEFLRTPTPTLLYSLYAPSIPQFRVEMGPRAEGVLWATVTGTYSDHVAKSFADRYRSAYAVSPGRSHAGIAYDRVQILADAWTSAESARDFRAVAGQIRQRVHRGVNGAYSFTGTGQSALTYPLSTADPSIAMAHLVFQIQDNRQRIVYPAPYTEAAFRQPPWWPV